MSTMDVKRRTGGRSARVRSDVLTHALFVLVEQGYSGFNIAEIAQRAQVHETTIYRRWPTREALMLAAIAEFAQHQLTTINSGHLEQDLRHNLTTIAQVLNSQIGKTLIALAFNPDLPAELKAMTQQLWQDRLESGQQIFQYAIARGEWPQHYNQALLFNEVIGPLLSHHFLLHLPLTDDFLEQRVQFILTNSAYFALNSAPASEPLKALG